MNIATPFFKNNPCGLCPRQCNVDRKTAKGFCKASDTLSIAHYSLHFGEEPCISGTRGSGTVFFEGCTLRCRYCQNYEISRTAGKGTSSPEELSEIMRELVRRGAHNINLVTPTHFAPSIAKALDIYRPNVPIVYNTSGYESVETLRALEPYVDVWLTDLKYVDSDLSSTLSNAKNYFKCALSAIEEMVRQQPKCEFSGDGTMQKGVIVRHLVLPAHLDDTRRVLQCFSSEFKEHALLSLMSQYTPPACLIEQLNSETLTDNVRKTIQEINRPLKPLEYKLALAMLQEFNIENGFVQELSAATDALVPNFKVRSPFSD